MANDNHIIKIHYREEKTYKNGRKEDKEIKLKYRISKEIASREQLAELDIPIEVARVLYESSVELKNARNYEYKHDVLSYEEGITELAMALAREAVFSEVESRIHYEELYKALRSLSRDQRTRLYLYYGHGKTYREIAELEGISFQAIQQSIRKTRKKLKKLLNLG